MALMPRSDAEPAVPFEQKQPLRLNAGDRQRVVVKFLRGLPSVERQILSLRFFERMSDAEIASLTSLSLDDVRARLSRMMRAVEAALVAENETLWSAFGGSRRRA